MTFKHLNYNLTTYSTLTLLLSHTIHPFSIRHTIFIQYPHTNNSYYSTLNSPPSSTHQHDQIHPSTYILLQAHHPHCTTHRYFKAWCAPSQISNIIIFISLYCNLRIHAGTLTHCIHHLCSILYNTYPTAHLHSCTGIGWEVGV